MTDKWFPAQDRVIDPGTKEYVVRVSTNVIGRFMVYPVLDIETTTRANQNVSPRLRRNYYKNGVQLQTKAKFDAQDRQTHDISVQRINAALDPEGADAAIQRFPTAWQAFCRANPALAAEVTRVPDDGWHADEVAPLVSPAQPCYTHQQTSAPVGTLIGPDGWPVNPQR